MKLITLLEAFRRCVLDDEDFIQAIDAASELKDTYGSPSDACIMRTGDFPGRWGLWPAILDPDELVHAWFDHVWPVEDGNLLLIARRGGDPATLDLGRPLAVRAVEVYERFLRPLRSGAVQATGTTRAGNREPISAATWHRPATLIDVHQGEISRFNARARTNVVEREWTSIELTVDLVSSKTSEPHSGYEFPSIPRRNGIDWVFAMDELLLRLSTGETFKTKKDVALAVFDALNASGRKVPTENDTFDHFRKRFPKFWSRFP